MTTTTNTESTSGAPRAASSRTGRIVRRLFWTAPVAAALALAACGGAGGHGTLTTKTPPSATSSGAPQQRPATAAATRPRGRVITARTSRYGSILTDGSDRTIYLFTRDRSTASTCVGPCATAWPPVLTTGAPRHAGGLTAALGTTRRRDGTVQVTYGGHPLYYYVNDVRPGEILCQNVDEFGGTWLVVSPRGTAVR
jgi:predicted lipoprotein with Yx(FWY)xxD motif